MNTAEDKALLLIEKSALMKEIVRIEPEVKAQLLAMAQREPSPGLDRWAVYSELKRKFYPYIGWGARNEALATTWHYEAFIDFIDALLPQDYEYDRVNAAQAEEYESLT
jgi:hypothetical protein